MFIAASPWPTGLGARWSNFDATQIEIDDNVNGSENLQKSWHRKVLLAQL
jgi:hypothetical protein